MEQEPDFVKYYSEIDSCWEDYTPFNLYHAACLVAGYDPKYFKILGQNHCEIIDNPDHKGQKLSKNYDLPKARWSNRITQNVCLALRKMYAELEKGGLVKFVPEDIEIIKKNSKTNTHY